MNGTVDIQYTIRHVTGFTYTARISESVMEVRMQPRSDEGQRCLRFELITVPRARIFAYRDSRGNAVHHFDIPGRHAKLHITAHAVVQMSLPALGPLPTLQSRDAWDAIDAAAASGEYWDSLAFSHFACGTPRLRQLSHELGVGRDTDPLGALRQLTAGLYDAFEYVPRSTRVDSPIDEALESRTGVCQDFAHIMIALVRTLGIPCRYVSGYLSPSPESRDRSAEGATHAWVEAFLPEIGWVGFDPTNNVMTGDRHIRVAIGRDYGDVPPTRGVFRGEAGSELAAAVTVSLAGTPIRDDDPSPMITWVGQETYQPSSQIAAAPQQQQQQQQQQ